MKTIFLSLLILASSFVYSQTHGTLTFKATTVNYPAPYSPLHILAIWISKESGQWVKTRKYMAVNVLYRQYLTNFKNATNGTYNAIDAITGPTLSSHVTHIVYWDGKDVNGNIVPDGVYRVYIEFTSANATGKLYFAQFTKGRVPQSIKPPNQPFFTNISVNWRPVAFPGIINPIENLASFECYPNPFSDYIVLNYSSTNTLPVIFRVFDPLNRNIKTFHFNTYSDNASVTWDGRDNGGNMIKPGIYYVSAEQGEIKKVVKIIKK